MRSWLKDSRRQTPPPRFRKLQQGWASQGEGGGAACTCDLETPLAAPQTFVNQRPSSFQPEGNLSWFWLQPYPVKLLNPVTVQEQGASRVSAQSTHAILTEMGEGTSCMPEAQGSKPTTAKKRKKEKPREDNSRCRLPSCNCDNCHCPP